MSECDYYYFAIRLIAPVTVQGVADKMKSCEPCAEMVGMPVYVDDPQAFGYLASEMAGHKLEDTYKRFDADGGRVGVSLLDFVRSRRVPEAWPTHIRERADVRAFLSRFATKRASE